LCGIIFANGEYKEIIDGAMLIKFKAVIVLAFT
jgi:hypothetical protein